MVLIKNLVKKYKQSTILNNISVSFESGEIHGLIGRNGSGKTVFLKCVCGLIPHTSGSISINNKIIGKDMEIAPDTGAIIESPGFLMGYSGYENLKMLSMFKKVISKDQIKEVMTSVGLDSNDKKHVRHYSMGMKQRLGLAQAIMESPSLLILDEPMNGLDNQGVQDFRSILMNLKSKGTTIILATHNMEDINLLCDHVYQMDAGVLKPL